MLQETTENWQVILNPHAGCGKGMRDKGFIINVLKKSGLPFNFHTSNYPGHAIELSYELSKNGNSKFIVAGGDGTLHEIVNGIFSAGKTEKVTIGVIPVGTGNDWIRTFGIPDDYEKAVKAIIAGKSVIQDVGEISFSQTNIPKRYFVNIAGFGFDAMVAGKANELKNNGISGIRVYIQSFLWSFINYKVGHSVIMIDSECVRANLFSVSVGIGRYNGGGMMQVPDANPLKGEFHVTIIRKMSIWGIIKNFKKLYDGSFVSDFRVSTHVGKEVKIRSLALLSGEADGESLGKSSFTIRIIPHQLRVICGNIHF